MLKKPKCVLSYSGGKDSTLALYHMLQTAEPVALIAMLEEQGQRSRSHGMVILPFLMDRISRIKCSSMAAYHRWLDEAFHDYRTTTNGWHNPEYHLSC